MKNKTLADLLNRAAVAIKTPEEFDRNSFNCLIQDLALATKEHKDFIHLCQRAIEALLCGTLYDEGLKRHVIMDLTTIAKAITPDKLSLKVGKIYRTREGKAIQITAKLDEHTQMYELGYRFVGGLCGQYYTEHGMTYTDSTFNPGDLLEEIAV